MTTLEGTTPSNTYADLFRVVNGGAGLDATLRNITGGNGVATTINISTTSVEIGFGDGEASGVVLRDTRKKFINLGDASAIGATVNIDSSTAEIFQIGLDQNTTIDFTNLPVGISATDGRARELLLIVDQKGTNPTYFDITWTGVNWNASTLPVVSASDNATDVFRLIYTDDGSTQTWFGEIVGQNMGTP